MRAAAEDGVHLRQHPGQAFRCSARPRPLVARRDFNPCDLQAERMLDRFGRRHRPGRPAGLVPDRLRLVCRPGTARV